MRFHVTCSLINLKSAPIVFNRSLALVYVQYIFFHSGHAHHIARLSSITIVMTYASNFR